MLAIAFYRAQKRTAAVSLIWSATSESSIEIHPVKHDEGRPTRTLQCTASCDAI
jgi:hypothetical protein